MLETIYRVHVPLENGVEILYQIERHSKLKQEFDRDFIRATDKSFNAQTDGYNGELFADFTDLKEAHEAEFALILLASLYAEKVEETLAQEG